MKKIPLTQGKFAIVDDSDFEYLNQWKWHAQKARTGMFYACRKQWVGNGKYKFISMHRLLLNIEDTKTDVDHGDGNGLNNQRYNIRACTRSQNQMNRNRTVKNSTGFKGVIFRKKTNRFEANISCSGKSIHLGSFKSAQDAAIAYNKAAEKHHGQFAKLNQI